MRKLVMYCVLTGVVQVISSTAQANWSESFAGGTFDLPNWTFLCYPDVAKTYTHTINAGEDDNYYLSLDETISVGAMPPGSAFGLAGIVDDEFTDVRVGAVVNVAGDASRCYCAIAGRASYFIDDGSISGAPGALVSCYVLMIDWDDGPANMAVDVRKAVNLTNYMKTYRVVRMPGLGHARSYYAELDIVGSGPVYITGSIYEYKGGPLVVRTPTLVDTNGNDPWEPEDIYGAVFANGISGVTGINEKPAPAGYHTTFDDISSVSDGPAAVNPSPADGATGVSMNANLSWVEAAFATSRELWFGKKAAMQKITPPGKTYDPGPLEFGQTYEWRVDEVAPSGTVTTGHTWTFTTAECLSVDDFESYADDATIRAAWPHNIPGGYWYIFLETGTVHQGAKSMRFEYQNQYEPYMTETTKTFAAAEDWTANGVRALSLSFRGDDANVEQPMYIKLEDSTGKTAKVEHPYTHAVQSEQWHEWDIALEAFDGAISLAAIKKITIGTGNGTTSSAQQGDDADVMYIDDIKLCPARCFNPNNLDLRGDVNGDCMVDFKDVSILADSWLNEGPWP